MIVTFGKYDGKLVEQLLIRDPSYIIWMLAQKAPGKAMAEVCDEARRLIEIFDAKPFVVPCSGEDCKHTATRCSVYREVNLQCWCDQCDPYSACPTPGKLRVIRTYGDAIQHADQKGTREFLIRSLADLKGLKGRAQASKILAFFGDKSRRLGLEMRRPGRADCPAPGQCDVQSRAAVSRSHCD